MSGRSVSQKHKIPGEKLLHLINLSAQDHQPTVKWKVCYISQQQSFQYRRNLRNNLHPLYYRYTQTHMHTHRNIGTEKTRVGFEQVKQEFPSFSTLFCTRFPAKYFMQLWKGQNVCRRFQEMCKLDIFYLFSAFKLPIPCGSPSITNQNKSSFWSCNLPITSSPIKSEKLCFHCEKVPASKEGKLE